jgi:glycerophosphoryl diester phosphodiesterase
MSKRLVRRTACAAALLVLVPTAAAAAHGGSHTQQQPRLTGRAVLEVETYSPGPPSGQGLVPVGQTEVVINGIRFPTPSQPVEGFSGIVAGRSPGEILAMADNGFGGKANSTDFLIRAYHLTPDFKTARRGSGAVGVGDFVQFSDPNRLIGFPIVREATPERWLTGGDIDPESIQRGRGGDFWIGDEFGPWILHFDSRGRLLEEPISLPDGLVSPNNPDLGGGTATVPNSRGIEAMAMTPDKRYLVVVLEGAVVGDDPLSRRIYKYDTKTGHFARLSDHRMDHPDHMVADAQSVDNRRLAVIERDGGRGLAANFRRVVAVKLAPAGRTAAKATVVDLTAIPDPNLISLPPIHDGDVGLGDPFRVTCESIEALRVVTGSTVMLGCDNNLPNSGRNPALADDNELILVKAPGLRQ